ncbi:hypothetical protein L810_1830 [Burkholderia sp. AU4i]|nr:hypothetical protein L810_1830 [Burkholderia sp. AU4i]MDW9245743.1 hypothetical protein [Burkholderia cepacia]
MTKAMSFFRGSIERETCHRNAASLWMRRFRMRAFDADQRLE